MAGEQQFGLSGTLGSSSSALGTGGGSGVLHLHPRGPIPCEESLVFPCQHCDLFFHNDFAVSSLGIYWL